MEKFYIGQKVKFKDWDEMVEEYGTTTFKNGTYLVCNNGFVEDMKHLCGKTANITYTNGKNIKLNNFSCRGDKSWPYNTTMIKPY